MKKLLLYLLLILPWGASGFSKDSSANEPNPTYNQLSMGCYHPPPIKVEEKALEEMHNEMREAQGAYGRGNPNDYLKVALRAFRGTPKDLATFLEWSSKETGSAAGNEMNNGITVGLLCHWGDHQFAHAVSQYSQKIRKKILFDLWVWDYPGQKKDFAACFPETAAACGLQVEH